MLKRLLPYRGGTGFPLHRFVRCTAGKTFVCSTILDKAYAVPANKRDIRFGCLEEQPRTHIHNRDLFRLLLPDVQVHDQKHLRCCLWDQPSFGTGESQPHPVLTGRVYGTGEAENLEIMAYSQAGHAPLPSGREWPGTTCIYKGSHIHLACRSVCDRDQES